jgi:phosphoribosylaminoimidazole carboxylase PurE protein
MADASPIVGVVMGSSSDWDVMQHAVAVLRDFGVPHEAKVVSAHRMPDDMFAYAESASGRGLRAIVAGAGGAAHLPGMLAAKTIVPVYGVPVPSKYLRGEDSLASRSARRARPMPRCTRSPRSRPPTRRSPGSWQRSAHARPRRRAR